jgi:peptide/nickel transport system permease protein
VYRYVIRRILFLIPTLLLVSFLVYAIISVAPGDPAQLMLGEGATAQAVAAKRIELGLNKPFIVQYLVWLKNVVFHFDFGQ